MIASKTRITGILALAAAMAVVLLGWWLRPAGAQGTVDQAKLERGALLYAENCAVCHGDDGQGRVGATLAKDWPSIRPDLTVRTIIENGVPGSPMPAWIQTRGGPLTSADVDDLVYFILSWQTGGAAGVLIRPTFTPRPPIATMPNVEGDPNQGAVLFGENCSVCHGADGQGRIGATLAKDWSGIRPDLSVKQTIVNGIPGSAMPAWSQANGGPLSETEINNITAFILALPSITTQVDPVLPSERPLSWLSGWGGVVVFIVLAFALFGALWFFQRSPANSE